jgi:hypothetical protein
VIDIAVVISPDLIFASRAGEVLQERGYTVRRVDTPAGLEPNSPVGLIVVDWGSREADTGMLVRRWVDGHKTPPRVLTFGPHRDLDGARDARSLQLGPVLANSQLVPTLRGLPVPSLRVDDPAKR